MFKPSTTLLTIESIVPFVINKQYFLSRFFAFKSCLPPIAPASKYSALFPSPVWWVLILTVWYLPLLVFSKKLQNYFFNNELFLKKTTNNYFYNLIFFKKSTNDFLTTWFFSKNQQTIIKPVSYTHLTLPTKRIV